MAGPLECRGGDAHGCTFQHWWAASGHDGTVELGNPWVKEADKQIDSPSPFAPRRNYTLRSTIGEC